MPLRTVVVSVVEGRCDRCQQRIFPGQWFMGTAPCDLTYHEQCWDRMPQEHRPDQLVTWQLATGLPQPGSQEGNEPG